MNLQTAAERILFQLDDVLCQLSRADYTRPSEILNQSTIGQHIRHTLEFFLCLREGVESGCVSYDDRKRDRSIEEDQRFARAVLSEIVDFVSTDNGNLPLQLRSQLGLEDDAALEIPSSYYRELMYNLEHAVHHMALIRVAVNESFSDISLPADFGVASSTIRSKSFIK